MKRYWEDAEIVAQRMNGRVLPEGCEGGHWRAVNMRTAPGPCDVCDKVQRKVAVATDIGGGWMFLCLDCALLDCMGAKQ